MLGRKQVASRTGLWDRYWGQNKRQEAILSPITIPQVTARQGSPQVSSRFVCINSLPSRSKRDVKSHVSCVGAEVIGFRKDLQNNLAELKPGFGGQNVHQ